MTEETGKPKKRVATFKEVVVLGKRLEEVIKPLDGGCCYEGDHSDQSIADELGLSYHTVRSLRADLYGPLITNAEGEIAALRLQLKEALTRITELERQFGVFKLAAKFNTVKGTHND